jgi:thaumarchaeosortase
MPDIARIVKDNKINLLKLAPLLAFVVPFLILYFFQSTTGYYYSFEMTWKGRTFYIFFLWLATLELILSWDGLQPKITKLKSVRTIALFVALLLPTMYIISSNYYGVPSKAIVDWSWQSKIEQPDWMPLHVEYLVLAAFSALLILLQYGKSGFKSISISPVFLAAIGTIYVIDEVYRYGRFTPFQIFVPTTAILAENVLKLMGYQTKLLLDGSMPFLSAANSNGRWAATIAWPCSGVESLIIYVLTILLFLKKTVASRIAKVIYFTVGAVVTYLINILRIVTIFVIGVNGGDWRKFHDYYGQLYSIAWIVCYPLIIIVGQAVWTRFTNHKVKANMKEASSLDVSPPQT